VRLPFVANTSFLIPNGEEFAQRALSVWQFVHTLRNHRAGSISGTLSNFKALAPSIDEQKAKFACQRVFDVTVMSYSIPQGRD